MLYDAPMIERIMRESRERDQALYGNPDNGNTMVSHPNFVAGSADVEMIPHQNGGAMVVPEAIAALRANQNGDTVVIGGGDFNPNPNTATSLNVGPLQQQIIIKTNEDVQMTDTMM